MRRFAWRLAEMSGAWGLAVAAPVLGLLERSPTYFVALRASPWEIVALAVGMAILPPALLAGAVAALERWSARAAAVVELAIVAVLAAALAAPPLLRAGLGVSGGALALGIGAACAVGLARTAAARTLLRFTAVSAIVVPASFFLSIPLRPVLSPPRAVAAASAEARRPAPIVFLVFDELPLVSLLSAPDTIDAARFPSFARLARSSTWYARAVTPGSSTDLAVPALLSGRRPTVGGVPPIAPSHPVNLFSLLPPSWPIAAFENVTALCRPSRCGGRPPDDADGRLGVLAADAAAIWLRTVTPSAVAGSLPSIEGRWGDYWGLLQERPTRLGLLDSIRFPELTFQRFLASLGPSGRPWLAFAHLNLPHMPHQFLPTGQRYSLGREALPGAWSDGPDALLAEQRHLLAIGYADRLLGALLDRLEASGLGDEVLLVVASDHGVAFRPTRSSRAPDADTLGEIAAVPLFVRTPRQREGRRDDRPFELTDLLPLLAQEVGLTLPPGLDGAAEHPASRTHLLMDAEGGTRTFTADEAAASLARATARHLSLFGEGSWERPFAAGPRPDLFGTSVASLSADASHHGKATIDQVAMLERVDPRDAFLPALLSGELVAAPRGAVAVALNGRVAAVVKPSERSFRALLPWSWLQPGGNDLRLFVVDEAKGGPVRAELRVAGAPTLTVDGVALGGERPLRLGERPRGIIEHFAPSARGHYLKGAVEGGAWEGGSTELMVFAEGRLVARARAGGGSRPELSARGWRAAAEFSLDVPLPSEVQTGLRVIAVDGHGAASELPLPATAARSEGSR